MPKFPERQSALIKKAEDTEADTAEQSAIKLRAQQQQPSNALIVIDQPSANGSSPVGPLTLATIPSISTNADADQGLIHTNGMLNKVDSQSSIPSPDLGDLLAIEGPPAEENRVSGLDGVSNAIDALALAPIEDQSNSVQVRGVKPLSLPEMANLFNSFQLTVSPGLDPNPNNLVASTTLYSESTRAMLCLGRAETDPSDRTQLRMTVASGDPTLTLELKEFLKEQLISIPGPSGPAQPHPVSNPNPAPAPTYNDPGAMLAGLL